MKIGEARKVYSNQIHQLQNRKQELLKQKKENEKSQNHEANKGVILELSKVEKQYDIAKDFMEKFSAYTMLLHNAEATKQQGEAAEKYTQEMTKCLEIARRISKGDIVPAYDEQKLIEYSYELYMAAKNMAIMNADKEHEKHDSLWKDDEEEKTGKQQSASEIVNDMECGMTMPSEVSGDISVSE